MGSALTDQETPIDGNNIELIEERVRNQDVPLLEKVLMILLELTIVMGLAQRRSVHIQFIPVWKRHFNRHNHHTLLHIPINRRNEIENTNVKSLQVNKVELPVVMIEIQEQDGLWRQVRALIDSEIDTHLIRKDIMSQLGSEKELDESRLTKKVKEDIKLVNGHVEVRLKWKKGFPTKLPNNREETIKAMKSVKKGWTYGITQ
ncbi:unnamed protein product [Lepeophtheirus salmonis]|uniref:(salmon louse) hypothetical protein n=1 Tax=Lepeophtheirus salmonis TaxID=72036 RepID=A0A7R8CFJ1_LEPSM|nr:unnamed protein product [Lepeophtheirus salmonis]CAF2806936.1 unnamed protein product [Lepeophtheirus salmonis]